MKHYRLTAKRKQFLSKALTGIMAAALPAGLMVMAFVGWATGNMM